MRKISNKNSFNLQKNSGAVNLASRARKKKIDHKPSLKCIKNKKASFPMIIELGECEKTLIYKINSSFPNFEPMTLRSKYIIFIST